jgi:hypothetical protein
MVIKMAETTGSSHSQGQSSVSTGAQSQSNVTSSAQSQSQNRAASNTQHITAPMNAGNANTNEAQLEKSQDMPKETAPRQSISSSPENQMQVRGGRESIFSNRPKPPEGWTPGGPERSCGGHEHGHGRSRGRSR